MIQQGKSKIMTSIQQRPHRYTEMREVPSFDNTPTGEAAPRTNWSEAHESEHFVQFYETDEFLLDSLSRFIGSGLGAGTSCLVVATKAHREGLEERLRERGLEPSVAYDQGTYLWLDAAETLAQFMVDGQPDPTRFAEVIGKTIEQMANGQRPLRIFGEMVALLWEEGNQSATIRLEELWNELRAQTVPFSLFCAYPLQIFAGEEYTEQFTEICEQHTHALPGESYAALASPEERLRTISLLQQKAASLEAEVAERKAIERRLRISENRYRRLFEASTDGILMVNPHTGTITDANPFLADLLGYSHEELLGKELWQIGLFPDHAATSEALRKLQEDRFLHYGALAIRSKDGRICYVEFVSTIFQTNGHELIQCNIRDITDRTRAEMALRASEERFRTLANEAPLMIWQSDISGSSVYVNTTWCRFTGLTEKESLGFGWTQAIHSEDRDAAIDEWVQAIATRVPYHTQFRLRRCDGVYRYVLFYGNPYADPEGIFTGYIGTIVDITEQKELEVQREAFISLVTHELKTPLTALQGNVQLSHRWLTRLLGSAEQLPAEQREMLEEVLTRLNRSQQQLRVQNRLINDLLDVSHIQENKLELNITPCDLVELVSETVQDYQAAHSTRCITLELPEQSICQVHADRDRLQQVLSNYLTNALKFSPESEPVHVKVLPRGEEVRVEVQDHGPGLTHAQQEHIWDRLYQATQMRVQNGWRTGLGLGLYISQKLISQQHGQVGVESTPGNGATFWFTLPLRFSQPASSEETE